jgi:hypothetical protein
MIHRRERRERREILIYKPQRTQRRRAATKKLFLAEPVKDTEKKRFFNNFIHIFLCVLCELCESHLFS